MYTASTLTAGKVGQFYSANIATAEVPPGEDPVSISYALAYGSLPMGLSLSSDGIISGTPASGSAGTRSFGVRANADGCNSKTVAFSLSIAGDPNVSEIKVSGSTLAAKLLWIKNNAKNDTSYIVEVNANESIGPQYLNYGKSGITICLRGTGGVRTISLTEADSLFDIASGITLILDGNITLKGVNDNEWALVYIRNGATIVMNSGSLITGNNTDSGGGGIYVSGGSFTMNGGTISGNNTDSGGGGIYVYGGSFTMNGGTISGNNADYGGGIYVSGGSFTMNGGTISGNNADYGGGIYASDGSYTINDGIISGNTAIGSGGGVYVSTGNLAMNGGAISGNTAEWGGGIYVGGYASSPTLNMNGGAISSNAASYSGGGIYVYSGDFIMSGGTVYGSDAAPENLKNTAESFGASLNLLSSGTGTARYGNGAVILNSSSYSNETLIGKKGDIGDSWFVTWQLNGGSWASGYTPPALVAKNGTLSEPGIPLKTNSIFAGWYKESGLINKVNFPYDVSGETANIFLYAKWEAAPVPSISFVARSPAIEYVYENGFLYGSRINFNLIVNDSAGLSSITIEESFSGTSPNGISHSGSQTRVIPITGPGTYQLSQEIKTTSSIYPDSYSGFSYTVKAHGKSYSTNYTGMYSSYTGQWSHYFVIK